MACKCFRAFNKDREFYTFDGKFVRDFIRRSIKGGKCGSFIRYFECTQLDEIMLTIKKLLKVNDNEVSNIVNDYLKYSNFKRDGF